MGANCEYLPEEVLEEIMSWLPPESLKRFKSVCKLWYVLISSLMNNSAFVAKHLGNMKTRRLSSPSVHLKNLVAINYKEELECIRETYLLTFVDDGLSDDPSNSYYIPCVAQNLEFIMQLYDKDFKLVCHCNGIICLFSIDRDDNIVLLNPALKELKSVSNEGRGDGSRHGTRLIGFGYDSRANDFKVATIKSLGEDDLDDYGPYKAEVYTLSTNSWKDIELNVEISYFTSYDYQVVYCKGVCYSYSWCWGCTIIISFDVGDEVFQIIHTPQEDQSVDEWDDLAEWTRIAVWNESIVLFFYAQVDPIVIDMWIMDACSYSWTKNLTIGPLVGISYPLAFWDDDELLMETKDGEIIFYNLPNRELSDHTGWLERFQRNHIVIYTKSLVSVLKRGGR